MTKIVIPSYANVSASFGAINYWPLGSGGDNSTSSTLESDCQITWRTAGTFSNMYLRVISNSNTDNSVATYRVGAANGNQIITVGNSATGEFTDSTHTDAVSAGNNIDGQLAAGSTGLYLQTIAAFLFAPTTSTNTVNKLNCTGLITDTNALTTYYNSPSSSLQLNATESGAQFKNKTAATLQNLFIDVNGNTASVATVKSRVNTANGNLTVSIGSGVTGFIEDTTHNDSIVLNDLINTALNMTVGANLALTNIAMDYLTTSGYTQYIGGDGGKSSIASASTMYGGIAKDLGNSGSTESDEQLQAAVAFTASFLEAYVTANSLTATSTLKFRKNAANGNMNLSYGSGVTGYLEDSTHTDSVSSSDEINYQIITGGTGTSIAFGAIGILALYSAVTFQGINWFPEYTKEVKAPSLAAKYTQVALPIIPTPIAQTDWYPAYSAEIKPSPLNSVGFVTPPIPAISLTVTVLNWFPVYPAEVKVAPTAVRYNYFAEMLAAPIAINNWLAVYDPKLQGIILNSIGFTAAAIPAITQTFTPIKWYPTYSADIIRKAAIAQCGTIQPFNLISPPIPPKPAATSYGGWPKGRERFPSNIDPRARKHYDRPLIEEDEPEIKIEVPLNDAVKEKDDGKQRIISKLLAELRTAQTAAERTQIREDIAIAKRMKAKKAALAARIDEEETAFFMLLH